MRLFLHICTVLALLLTSSCASRLSVSKVPYEQGKLTPEESQYVKEFETGLSMLALKSEEAGKVYRAFLLRGRPTHPTLPGRAVTYQERMQPDFYLVPMLGDTVRLSDAGTDLATYDPAANAIFLRYAEVSPLVRGLIAAHAVTQFMNDRLYHRPVRNPSDPDWIVQETTVWAKVDSFIDAYTDGKWSEQAAISLKQHINCTPLAIDSGLPIFTPNLSGHEALRSLFPKLSAGEYRFMSERWLFHLNLRLCVMRSEGPTVTCQRLQQFVRTQYSAQQAE